MKRVELEAARLMSDDLRGERLSDHGDHSSTYAAGHETTRDVADGSTAGQACSFYR